MGSTPLNVFVSYAHEDEPFRIELGKWLRPLERNRLLKVWHDRQIRAGQEWADVIEQSLDRSDLVLLLISPDFIASEYCFHIELAAALDRHNRGLSLVVPIFARAADFSAAPFAKLQGLPRDAMAVASWKKPGDAFRRIVSELQQSARLWAKQKTTLDARVGETAQLVRQDAERMQKYYQTFLRPAFSVPCIFEGSLQDFAAALDSLTEALATGKVMNRNRELVQEITPLVGFSTITFKNALHQVLLLLARTRSSASTLMASLEALGAEFSAERRAARDLEVLLEALGRRARDQQEALIAHMSEIDAQRNAAIRILNYLFELSGIPLLPSITLSSDLLRASRAMDALGIAGAFTLYYLPRAPFILADVPHHDNAEANWRARLEQVQPSDYDALARHIENQLSGPLLLADPDAQARFRKAAANVKFQKRLALKRDRKANGRRAAVASNGIRPRASFFGRLFGRKSD